MFNGYSYNSNETDEKQGLLDDLDESSEINTCSIKVQVDVDEKRRLAGNLKMKPIIILQK